MDQNVQIKLEWENSLRRASVSRTETLAGVKRVVAALLELDVNKGPLDLTYKDEEGDTITVGSDLEIRQLLDDAFATKKSLRFTVVAAAAEKKAPPAADDDDIYEQEEEQEPEQPDFPFANVARALSDRQTVERVLLTLQSEAVVSAVTSFATTYAETQGNQALAGMAVLPQVPGLMGVVAELVNEVPVLKDVQELVMPMIMAQCWGASVPPMAQACGNEEPEHRHCPPHGRHGHCPRRHGHCRPHHGGHGGHHGHCRPHPHGGHHGHHEPPHHDGAHPEPPHHDGAHHGGPQEHGGFRFAQVHFGVLCDGCASDDALKQQALRDGYMTHRGFIRGTRYKSQSIQDFDLCESCHANEQRFPGAVYGPFTSMAPPERPKCWGWGQGRGAGRGGHGGPWRRGCGTGKTEREVPAAQEATSEPQTWDGLMGAFRQAVSQGAEAFSQAATAAKGEGGEFAEIARAIAESLKETQPGKAAPVATANPAEKPVEEAKPVVEEAKPAAADPFAKWAQQLRQLETLGFDKSETYIGFLEEENGDLERVVNRIVRRDM